MNKQWQDEIYKITQFIQNSANQAEFKEIVDELNKRTKELETIKAIENGKVPCQAIADLVAQCEQRHDAQSKGKIEDKAVLQDNERWQGLMNMLKEFILNNQSKLEERNAFYLKELQGRIGDLSNFKNILSVQIEEEKQDLSKLRKKEKQAIKAKKVSVVVQNAKNLSNGLKQRHVDIEADVKKTMDLNKQREQQEMQSLVHNDEAWRKEFDEDTQALIEFLV